MAHFQCVSLQVTSVCTNAPRVLEKEVDKDGEKNVCMCIHKTASGADRLLNLQLGTGGKEDED